MVVKTVQTFCQHCHMGEHKQAIKLIKMLREEELGNKK